MKLALQNILHDRTRFVVAVIGIAFAVFLMIFQGSLLVGVITAASKLVDSADSDVWITARGVNCFDFSAKLASRFLDIARGVPGVESTSRVTISFAEYRKPQGEHEVIALVGADPDVGSRFPLPRLSATQAVDPESVVVDRTSASILSVKSLPQETEINGHRAHVTGFVDGFSAFLGCPYVFTSYRDAIHYSGLAQNEAVYILVRVGPGYSTSEVKHALQVRLPEVDVWTREEFAARSALFWLAQTGAGGAILAAALLGFFIGLVVVSQTMYATTMEHIEEFATLKALGASRGFVMRIVLIQALACGLVGFGIGLLGTVPMITLARHAIPWILTPWWMAPAVVLPGLVMCVLASIVSIRTAISVDPGKVFRA